MLESRKDRLIYLTHCYGLGHKQCMNVLQRDPTLQYIFNMKPEEIMSTYRLKLSIATQITDQQKQTDFLTRKSRYSEEGIRIVTLLDQDYPELLKQTFDPPVVLYLKGDPGLLNRSRALSVVGTRYPSKNGKISLQKILTPMVRTGWTIISGLAIGIDVESHKLAIQNDGSTIAVLGSGFNHIYPKEHIPISRQIAVNHLLISEYPPDRKPAKWQFPMRNRIISGLSRGTLIIEAREKSGSLITGDFALQEGREVFAVPGSILEPCSAGTNHLIQQGAKLTTCAEDIYEELSDFSTNV